VSTLALVFLSNLSIESRAEDRIVLRALVRAFEQDLRIQSALLVGGGVLVTAAADPRVRRYADGIEQRSTVAVRRFGVVPTLLVASALLFLLLVAV
jgi:hypothetical protein